MHVQESESWRASLALFLATGSFQLLFLERGVSLYDEGSILAIGQSLANGEVLYRDRLTFVAPLCYELLGLLYRIFDPTMMVGRVSIALLFAVVVVIVHRIFLLVLPRRVALAAALALWPIKALGFPLWTMVNYTQVALPFKVGALWALLEWFRGRKRICLVSAGLLVGLAISAKQDYGAYAALAMTVAVVFDWMTAESRRLSDLLGTLVTLGLVALVPIVVLLAYYSWHGAGLAFLNRTVLDLAAVPADYQVPLPGLQPWSKRGGDLFLLVFSYFPAAFVELSWASTINVYDRSVMLLFEAIVKAVYYLPWLSVALLVATALRGGEHLALAERSSMVLIAAVAAIGYALIFRADWSHLMNLYTLLLMPVALLFGRWYAAGGLLGKIPGLFIWTAWMAYGLAGTVAVCSVYDVPIETPRGRILDVARTAANVRGTLDYLARQPPETRILFMPYNALYYFLTDRPILAANDLVMPGLVAGDADDVNLARATANADKVVYNPKIVPTAPAPLYAYAPRTAMQMGSEFSFERALSDTAVVLRRGRDVPLERVVDLWEGGAIGSIEPVRVAYTLGRTERENPPLQRDHWVVYRTVSLDVSVAGKERCFLRHHCVAPGEAVAAWVSGHPEGWGLPAGKRIHFELRLGGPQPASRFSRTIETQVGPVEVIVPLAAATGHCVDLHFCANAEEAGVARGVAGWAEPQIISLDGH